MPLGRAIHCRSSSQILLNAAALSSAAEEASGWDLGYWLAIALAEALPPPVGVVDSQDSAAANLQVNCLAGVLLASSNLTPPRTSEGRRRHRTRQLPPTR